MISWTCSIILLEPSRAWTVAHGRPFTWFKLCFSHRDRDGWWLSLSIEVRIRGLELRQGFPFIPTWDGCLESFRSWPWNLPSGWIPGFQTMGYHFFEFLESTGLAFHQSYTTVVVVVVVVVVVFNNNKAKLVLCQDGSEFPGKVTKEMGRGRNPGDWFQAHSPNIVLSAYLLMTRRQCIFPCITA